MYIVNFRMDMFFSGYLDIMSLKRNCGNCKAKALGIIQEALPPAIVHNYFLATNMILFRDRKFVSNSSVIFLDFLGNKGNKAL